MAHRDGITGRPDRGIDEHRVGAELHGLGCLRRRADAGVDDHGDERLLDDDLERRFRAQALVGADPRAERHDRRAAGVLEPLAQDGVGVAVGQHGEVVGAQDLGRLQRLDRVGQEVPRLGRDLELDPRR